MRGGRDSGVGRREESDTGRVGVGEEVCEERGGQTAGGELVKEGRSEEERWERYLVPMRRSFGRECEGGRERGTGTNMSSMFAEGRGEPRGCCCVVLFFFLIFSAGGRDI